MGLAGGGDPENALIGPIAIVVYNGQRAFGQVEDDVKVVLQPAKGIRCLYCSTIRCSYGFLSRNIFL